MEIIRLFDLLEHVNRNFQKNDLFSAKEYGEWKAYSTKEIYDNAHNFAYGLLASGLQKDDKIATLSNNRPQWNMVDLGMMMAGAIHVPIYPTISNDDLTFILKDAEIKYIFVSNNELWNKIQQCLPEAKSVKGVFTFDHLDQRPHWTELVELGKKNVSDAMLTQIKSTIKANDLATLLYTSGTTGTPKGVMLSHDNIISQIRSAQHLCPVGSEGRALSFLPLNHVYERVLTYLYMFKGVSVYYAESIEKVSENLKEVHPDIFGCVPRLFEKVYDRIVAKGAELTGIKKNLFFWALQLGLKYETNGANGWLYEQQLKLANKLIFSKWREALGGKVKVAISGGAALQPRLARVFWAAQIPVLEGYGLTETSPVVAVNSLEKNGLKFGTVGKVLNDVKVKIADDGEILTMGPNLMLGYYKRPDLTAEVIDSEGWFHTGDIGVFEESVYLKITDRKKEIFKTSGGKYITPQLIENKLKESRFIEQSMIVGENQKFAAALIVPAFPFLKEWCERKGINWTTNEEMIKVKEVLERIQEEVTTTNATLANYETLKKFELLSREWSIDRGEMTPKLSLKRKVIFEANKHLVDKMFG